MKDYHMNNYKVLSPSVENLYLFQTAETQI